MLRSLATSRPDLILERHRFVAAHPPEAVIDCTGGPPLAMFQNGTWNRQLSTLAIFDDVFVDENICSGLSLDSEHLIGAQGVALNQKLQAFVTRIEGHNAELRARAATVPAEAMAGMTIDAFCALQDRPTIDTDIQDLIDSACSESAIPC